MKLQSALMLAALSFANPAMAQTSSRDMKGGTPAQNQSVTKAKPAEPSTAAPSAASTTEKADPAKLAAIRHLMDITSTSKMGDSITNGITSQIHSVMGRAIPADRLQKFMETFSQKFSEAAPASAVNDNTATIYARHFSMEDIQGLTKFYESPLGQRVLNSLPEAQEEAYSSGQQMDQQAAMQILRGMSDEYTELKQMLPPDPSKPEPKPAGAPSPAAPPSSGSAPATKPAPAPAPASGAAPAPKPAPAPPQQ
ncbi:MAG TPA: DUF2059 domain-containing protein [Candidatus Limnocylindria bacterium]|nr:DUF2059 domain-containing protein [Candidatus Limnocylindria bacterium]